MCFLGLGHRSLRRGSQRYRREQADGQDQRQQQGYDSFPHFFFSPSCMVQFFCFLLSFFYVQRPGGRGLGGTEGGLGPLRRGRPLRRCAPAPLRKGSQGAYRNFLLQFLQKEKRGYPLLAVHGADDVANTICALILAQLAVKRKKFYWNLTFFDFSWYMGHGSTFGEKMQ